MYCTYNVTLKRFRPTMAAGENQYSGCVFVALGVQHAMRCATLSSLWPAPFYSIFAHYLIHGKFSEKQLLNTGRCVF